METKCPLVIAMPILSRSPEEACELRASVEQLSQHGWPMVFADGGSTEELASFLQTLPGATVLSIERQPGSGLVRQVKAALGCAEKKPSDWVLYTEPDKRWFFENQLASFVGFAMQHAQAGMILASRTASSFSTFPPVQQTTERLTNQLVGSFLELKSDFLYGPMLLRAELIPFLTKMPDDLGWGWRIFALVRAFRLGWPIQVFERDLPCPIHQRSEENERTRLYRVEQMAQNIRGLLAGFQSPL
ncbi:MAG: hypothetical protein AB1813_23080 [Verrucomicrobiota bacterium]